MPPSAVDVIVHAGRQPSVTGAPPTRVGIGFCPLVLGECVQGRLRSGRHFLITSPLALHSRAEFRPALGHERVRVHPPGRTKSREAVERYLAHERLPGGGELEILTPLEHSQGFGTSTADIVASLRAAADAWHRTVDAEAISRLAAAIEPTDGSMYAGCVAYAHREGLLLERLGRLPRFHAVVMCTSGEIDTVAFDRQRRHVVYPPAEERALRTAWQMVRRANQTGSVALLAEACTISAEINERLLPKPHFRETLAFVREAGAPGVMIGHSGTILAILIDPIAPEAPRLLDRAKAFVAERRPHRWFELSSDGLLATPIGGPPCESTLRC